MATDTPRVRSLLISVGECAERLETAPATIRKLVQSGDWIGSRYISGVYIIPRAAFDRLYVDGLWHDDHAPAPIPFLQRRTA